MKTINYHIKAITITFEELFKGNFLLFFIPGAILTVIYFWLTSQASVLSDAATLASDNSWFDWALGYVNSGVKGVFSFFGFITEQLYIFLVF